MNYFIFILVNIMLPIFIQIFLGYVIKKVTNFNNKPLAVIQFYIIVPALLFVSMYNTKIDRTIAIKIMLHSTMLFVLLYAFSALLCKFFKYNKTATSSFTNSICLYNSGNFCLPLVQLLYNNPIAVSVQIVIMTVQNIVTNTVGIYSISAGKKNVRQGILEVLKVPMIYCIVIALVLRGLEIKVATPTAVNSVLLAIQYNNDPDFASQAVFFSTIISAITVATVILLVRGAL